MNGLGARGLRADLSAMRVHTGPAADRLARGPGAEAFADGSHVFFRRGAYRPRSPSGFRLLTHEAAHLVQQARGEVGGARRGGWTVSVPGDPWEQEADRPTSTSPTRLFEREGGRQAVVAGEYHPLNGEASESSPACFGQDSKGIVP